MSAYKDAVVIRGVRIVNTGPIRETFLELPPGLTALYGLNGAGKSTALRAVRDAFTGVTDSELHFGCGLSAWRWLSPPSPWRFLAGVGVSEAEGELARNDELTRLRQVLDTVLADQEERVELVDDFADITVRLASALVADTPMLMIAMLEIVLQGRFVRTKGGLGLAASIDHETNSPLTTLWHEAMRQTQGRPATFLRQLLARSAGPETELNELVGFSAFIGCWQMVSVPRTLLGIPTPAWCGDVYWECPDWGAWPQPIIDPDDLPELTDLTIAALARSAESGGTWLGDTHDPSQPLEYTTDISELAARTSLLKAGAHSFERRPNLETLTVDPSVLLAAEGGRYAISPAVAVAAERLGAIASEINQNLLRGAPMLDCQILTPDRWARREPLQWLAVDQTGAAVPIDNLSEAQRRWSRFAIRLAISIVGGEAPPVILIDEPERALHRSAERHLIDGLNEVTARVGSTSVIATHSPYALGDERIKVHHVMRGEEGYSTIHRLGHEARERLDELGVAAGDLLHLCRTALMVEGHHEELIFQALFADEFARAGVEMFSVRGAKHLATASDAQLLFRYTDARLVVLVDNLDPREVQAIWTTACEQMTGGDDFRPTLNRLVSGKSAAEGQFLKNFCDEALTHGRQDRVDITALSLPDIIEYLPLHTIAPAAPSDSNWPALRTRHDKAARGLPFKTWMTREFGASYDDATILAAVSELQVLPEDFTQLLSFLRRS